MRDTNDWYGVGGGAVRPSPPRLDEIVPRLLVGEYPNVGDVPWLRDTHGVTAVVCLQDDADLASKRIRLADLERAYAAAAIAFDHVPILDGDAEMLAAWLRRIVARVRAHVEAGHVVYLHCNGGLNRAPTAAIAYVHEHEGLSLEAASDFVKRRRVCVPYVRALEICYGAG